MLESTLGLSVEIVGIEKIPKDRVPPVYRCGFSYTIKIKNQSGKTVQLLGRKWMIKQADGDIETVEGDGVVGEQPVIPHGSYHVYTSYCLLYGDHGSMWGYYFGKDMDDNPVMWQIPRFDMGLDAEEKEEENQPEDDSYE